MLRFTKQYNSFCSALVAVAVVSAISSAGHVREGISPKAQQWSDQSQKVFQKLEEDERKAELLYRVRTEQQVLKVISRYKTGLDKEDRQQISSLIFDESRKYGYDPLFLTAVIVTESSFNNWAKSRVGALGLMQIRPATARALASEISTEWKGKPTLYDPEKNIAMGAYYLNKLLERFGGLELALEAYNHGPSQLARYLRKGKRPHRYSRRVMKLYRAIRAQSI